MSKKSFLGKLAASRGHLTKTINKILDAKSVVPIDYELIEASIDSLKSQNERLDNLNEELETHYDDDESEELLEQYEKAEVYRSKAIETISIAKRLLRSQDSVTFTKNSVVKLPKITVPEFSGDVLKWDEFFELFTTAVDSQNISNTEKFQFLKQSLKGEAVNTICGLPLTSDNYVNALELLKSRYGSRRRILRAHVNAILNLESPNIKSFSSLRNFVDAVRRHVHGLNGQGISGENFEIFLSEILIIKMPVEIKHSWSKLNEDNMMLDSLLNIVECEAKHREIVNSSNSNPVSSNKITGNNTNNPVKAKLNRSFVTNTEKLCSICNSDHSTYTCPMLMSQKAPERFKIVKDKRLCVNCLRNHHISKCKSSSSCKHCNRRHHSLLHFNANKAENIAETSTSCVSSSQSMKTVLPTISVPIKTKCGVQYVGALLDTGSDRSFVSDKIVHHLDPTYIKLETLSVTSFNRSSVIEHFPLMRINLNTHSEEVIPFEVLVSSTLDNISVNRVKLDDSFLDCKYPMCKEPTKIDLIIGADNYYLFTTGNYRNLTERLKLIETKFGWVTHGAYNADDKTKGSSTILFTSVRNIDDTLDITRFWDNEVAGITPKESITNQRTILDTFEKNIKFLNCRYEVNLPWLNKAVVTNSLKSMCHSRLVHTTKRLLKDKIIGKYDAIIKDYLKMGIVEKCNNDKSFDRFIPHHPVVKSEAVSTKIRIVFDASSKETGQQSLNDMLFEGPNLFPSIIGIITRFRMFRYAATADIEKAFLQIGIHEADRNFTKFLWYENVEEDSWPSGKVVSFRFCRVPFGFRSSPFILNKVVSHHLNSLKDKFPTTVEKIQGNIYVDDLIVSTETLSELEAIATESTEIFKGASMNLHKWHGHLIPESNDSTVLGIVWNSFSDQLSIKLPSCSLITTKRELASYICSVFDPLGWYTPYTTNFKFLLQECWSLGLSWDESLPTSLLNSVQGLLADSSSIKAHSLDRWLKFDTSCQNVQLLSYSDASPQMYCAAVYLQFENNKEVYSSLLCAKSRIAPKGSKLTVPRLELAAALLSARLVTTVHSMLPHSTKPTISAFCDSQVALAWIRKDNLKAPQYVQNRVCEIRSLLPVDVWKYVPSKANPADLATRTNKTSSWLSNDLWWYGKNEFSSSLYAEEESDSEATNETDIICNFCNTTEPIIEFERFSNYLRLLSTMQKVLKFIRRLPDSHNFNKAEICLIRQMQQECFSSEVSQITAKKSVSQSSKYFQLSPFLDSDQVLRVNGRIGLSDIDYDSKFPILMDRQHHLTMLIIRHIHNSNSHLGVTSLCSAIRKRFWIPRCRRTCKQLVDKCVQCRRYSTKPCAEVYDTLPPERVQSLAMRPFSFTGVDYLGPIGFLSSGKKIYILLFTCVQIRAIHLEVTYSLNLVEFSQAFTRFVSRRGVPNEIRSDNAKTFHAAAQKLSLLYKIQWKFHTERAPWTGGIWERMVRSVKTALRHSIKLINFDNQDLITTVCHVENIINSRPISFSSGNDTELIPISPLDFILPINNHSNSSTVISKRPDLLQALSFNSKVINRFWTRWKEEYIPTLLKQGGRSSNQVLTIGEVVLLNESSKRAHWPLAKIMELFQGRDGHYRSAKLFCKGKTMTRPTKLLYPLEIQNS